MNWTVLVYDNRDDLVPPEDHLIVGAGSNGEVQAGRITSDGNLDLLELTQQQKDDIAAIWRDGIEDVIPLNVPDFHSKVLYGPKADIPVAGQPGGEERFYIATDEGPGTGTLATSGKTATQQTALPTPGKISQRRAPRSPWQMTPTRRWT